MVEFSSELHLADLLSPLHQAGWESFSPVVGHHKSSGKRWQVSLRRSCMVIGVQLDAPFQGTETLTLLPVADLLQAPDDGVGFFDVVTKSVTLASGLQGLTPFAVEGFAAGLGLLDPTRFRLPKHQSTAGQFDFQVSLFTTYIGRVAARWRGGNTMAILRELDADAQFSDLLKTAMALGSGVMPDPVPMAAAIGITLSCWRHTELETAHAGSGTLTDVAMARASIATTRAVRGYITVDGIDWDGLGGVLLDAERQLANDNSDSIGQLVGKDWPLVARSIQQCLDDWTHAEQVAGPEAVLRLASVMGSTTFTTRWWGNSWWGDYSAGVLAHVLDEFPEAMPAAGSYNGKVDFVTGLCDWPEELPDEVLSALIDPPDGQGLRRAPLPRLKVRVLHPVNRPARRVHPAA